MLTAGTQLGPYELLSLLGAGGMGEVYRARDSRLNRGVAIKVLPEHLAQDREALARFEREARAVAALSHPNILTIYDIGTEQGVSFAVMELLDGETLRSRLSRAAPSWRKAVEIGVAIAEGLSAAHAKGIIHRDLKPENIFLTTDGHTKILDFGLARVKVKVSAQELSAAPTSSYVTEPGTVMGTVSYLSPEQVRGEEADAPSDIFSFGCVLYEMVTGRRVFARQTTAETMAAILKDEPPELADSGKNIPYELEQIIKRCLEKNQAERFQSTRDLGFALKMIPRSPDLATLSPAKEPQRKPQPRHPSKQIESLAVLPFINTSDDPDLEYLSDGITESIIISLSQLPKLRVMARSTVFRYKAPDVDPQQFGRNLEVSAVLAGRVLQRGDLLVIGTELVDVASGSQLWGQQYKRQSADIFEIQDEIAREISEKLRLKLTGAEQKRLTKRYTDNPKAYQLYLKGRYCWNQRTEEGMRKGVKHFEQAIEEDPSYALAYTGLGDCYAMLGIYTALSPKASFPKAKVAERRALEIDSELAEAHASLGFALLYHDWDRLSAEKELRQAVRLNPGYASAHQWLGMCQGLTGRLEEAIAELSLAQQLDPFSASINTTAPWPLYWARRYDEAIERYRTAVDLHPNFWAVHYWLGLSYAQKGQFTPAMAELEKSKLVGDTPWRLGGLGHTYALAGERAAAQQVLDELRALSEQRYVSPYDVAIVYAGLGEKGQAFEWLEKAFEHQSWMLIWLAVDPLFDSLRADPRFADLLRRIGLVP